MLPPRARTTTTSVWPMAGETDMFQELSWNRVSICELIVKK